MGNVVAHVAEESAVEGLYDCLVKRFSRVTSSGRYIPELDGIRFIAIGLVFLQHTHAALAYRGGNRKSLHWDWFSYFVKDMHIGVELFFVISGFIVALPFAAHALNREGPVSLRAYFLRRVTRLEPPYVLTLILISMLLMFYRGSDARALFPHFVASLFYVHNIVYWARGSINAVAWSLEVEVQFYILAPLFARLFGIRPASLRRAALVALALGSIGLSRYLHRLLGFEPPPTILTFLPYFMVGFLMADLYLTDLRGLAGRGVAWDALALAIWLVLIRSVERSVPERTLVTASLLFGFFYGVFRGRILRRWLAAAPFRTIGGMCYSIYLLHNPLLRVLADFWPGQEFLGSLSVTVIAAVFAWGLPILLLSALFFILVEKPCMQKDWPRQLLARSVSLQRRVFRLPPRLVHG